MELPLCIVIRRRERDLRLLSLSLCHVRVEWSKQAALCTPPRGLSSNIEHFDTLILDFPAFKALRNKCHSRHLSMVFCYSSLIWLLPLSFSYIFSIDPTTSYSFFQFHLPVIWGQFSIFLGELNFWCDVFHLCCVKGFSSLLEFFTILCLINYSKLGACS